MKIRRILLDLDEVLTDFVGAACAAWGKTRAEVLTHWPVGVWDVTPPLSRALGLPQPMREAEFWARLNGKSEFWATMRPHPWACDLINLVDKTCPDDEWHVISAPSHCVSSYNGKVTWLKNYFGSRFSRFALTPHKHVFAVPGVVLIDDRDSNVVAFKAAGGEGIVFPTHHNSQHAHKADPLSYVRQQLAELEEHSADWAEVWRTAVDRCVARELQAEQGER